MSTGLLVTLIIIGVLLFLAFIVMICYNRFVRLSSNVEEAFSTMDVYLKKRYDILPNMVECVKGYMKHEKDILKEIVEIRSSVAKGVTNTSERLANEAKLTQDIKTLFAVAEQYPDLKSNTNFLHLQDDLNNIEMEIADARKYYNALANSLNKSVRMFPSNIIAKIFNFSTKPMFIVEDAQERKNVKVQF